MAHLPATDAGTVLELAHGTGDLQTDLQQAGYQVIGYDLSTQMGRIAQRKLKRQGLTSRLVQGRAQQLPFGDGRFPAVVVTFPTPFIFERETLLEVHRVLARDGVLVAVVSGTFTGGGVIKMVLEFAYRITGQRAPEDAAKQLPERLQTVFKECGFQAEYARKICPRSEAHLIVARKLVLPNSA